MHYRIFIVGFFAFILSATTQSQYLNISTDIANKQFLTGNLHTDLVMQTAHIDEFDNSANNTSVVHKNKYSPLAAGLFSAVLPGAGQFYTKSYWQSAAFFGAEVLSWVAYASFQKKGDQRTTAFQNYADEHWSVARYAGWINVNFGKSININPDQSLKSWDRVHWDDLNKVEDQIAGDQTIQPTGFTHKLAPYADQQYYEMIGKYSQFGGGWDDATSYTKADVLADNGIGIVSPEFTAYSHMRGDANSSYNIATTVSYVIVANHVFSALEAALNASRIDHKIQLQGHIQSRIIYGNLVEFVPTLQVKYGL